MNESQQLTVINKSVYFLNLGDQQSEFHQSIIDLPWEFGLNTWNIEEVRFSSKEVALEIAKLIMQGYKPRINSQLQVRKIGEVEIKSSDDGTEIVLSQNREMRRCDENENWNYCAPIRIGVYESKLIEIQDFVTK